MKKRGRKLGSKNSNKQVKNLKHIDPEKVKLIKAIWKKQPEYKTLEIDLCKYTMEELQFHLKKIKGKT